jgi:hypothetical protein
MLLDGDSELLSLLGPFKPDAQERAIEVMERMLATDKFMSDAMDWESDAVCAPYFYHELRVMSLSWDEVTVLAERTQVTT